MKDNDEYAWLEKIEGEGVNSWVEEQNTNTLSRLKVDQRFQNLLREFSQELASADQLLHFHRPNIILRDNYIYEIWQDKYNPRGVLRRTLSDNSGIDASAWEILLDIDELAKKEGRDFYIHSFQSSRFSPSNQRLLINFTEGGADAQAIREFDLDSATFVAEGFNVPVKIQSAAWLTDDQIIIASPINESEKTQANYPRVVRLWRRGECLEDAPVIFEISATHVAVNTACVDTRTQSWSFIVHARSVDDAGISVVSPGGSLMALGLPPNLGPNLTLNGYLTLMDHHLLIRLGDDWTVGGEVYPAGCVVAVDLLKAIDQKGCPDNAVSLVYLPAANEAVDSFCGFSSSSDAFFINVMHDVVSKLVVAKLADTGSSQWALTEIELPEKGKITLPMMCNRHADHSLVLFESFLTPPTLYAASVDKGMCCLRVNPKSSGLKSCVTTQHFVTTQDGVDVPYFVTGRPNQVPDGAMPTLVYAYGHFGTSMQPTYDHFYFGLLIRYWLKQGWSFVAINPRGGGEYGKQWHDAGKGKNQQTTYEDIYTVCEDIIHSGLSAANRIGMIGGSCGGLTMGVSFVQRPDLSNATISAAGFFDLIAYKRLGQGSMFTSDYGDPEDPEFSSVLRRISPYHNIDPAKIYYEPLFMAATLDDRVHPAHVRKMVAKMQGYDLPVLYFEAKNGGHLMAANDAQRAFNATLQTIYLIQRLVD